MSETERREDAPELAEVDPAEVARLEAQARVRPGDPVARARLAVALRHDQAEGPTRVTEGLIRTCLRLGALDPAIEAATLLHRRFRTPELAIGLADAWLTRHHDDDVERARALLSELVSVEPDPRASAPSGTAGADLEARLRLAALALGRGEVEAALAWTTPIVAAGETKQGPARMSQASAAAMNLHANVLLAAGRADEAAGFAEEALDQLGDAGHGAPEQGARLQAESQRFYQVLGIAELARGRTEAAVAALSEALRLAPEDPTSYYNLALAFEAAGSPAAALGVVEAGLELFEQYDGGVSPDPRLVALRARLLA